MNNIVENNRLIAEFLCTTQKAKDLDDCYILKGKAYHIEDLPFDTDWNWLMEVVQAIEEKGYVVAIKGISCAIYPLLKDNHEDYISSFVCGDLSKKIDIVHSAIIGFIKWYNQQKTLQLIQSGELDTEELKSTFMAYLSEKYNIDWDIVTEYTDEYFENLLPIEESEKNFMNWYNQQSK